MQKFELWNYFLEESGHDLETLSQWLRERTECLEALWRLCNTPGYPSLNTQPQSQIQEQLQSLQTNAKLCAEKPSKPSFR